MAKVRRQVKQAIGAALGNIDRVKERFVQVKKVCDRDVHREIIQGCEIAKRFANELQDFLIKLMEKVNSADE